MSRPRPSELTDLPIRIFEVGLDVEDGNLVPEPIVVGAVEKPDAANHTISQTSQNMLNSYGDQSV
jgi:hypothetical protein